ESLPLSFLRVTGVYDVQLPMRESGRKEQEVPQFRTRQRSPWRASEVEKSPPESLDTTCDPESARTRATVPRALDPAFTTRW
ncbi:Protein of unknown function, partial [Gryllus bimaculatus]